MKSIVVLYVAVFATTVLVGCSKKSAIEEERASLLRTDREFSQASAEHGAAEAFRLYLAENALQLPARQEPVRGRENIFNSMKSAGDDYTLTWEPVEGDVAQSGEMGYTWGKYTLSSIDDFGAVKKSYGKYLNVWQKDADGAWKVLIDIGNQSPDGGE